MAIQHFDVLLLARQDVEHRQPRKIAVLQVLQLLAEDDVGSSAIAVEQEEASRLTSQHGLQDRHHRRDPGPCGERHERARRPGLDRHAEASIRRHHRQRVARMQLLVHPGRERSARQPLDHDTQFAVVEAGADRVGPPHILAVDRGTQRQILAWRVAIRRPQPLRDGKGERHRVRRLATDIANRQGVKARPGHGGVLRVQPVRHKSLSCARQCID